ncbi:MAG: hypothetical protein ACO3FE_20280, partial [Planctomycetaceae bacterium]
MPVHSEFARGRPDQRLHHQSGTRSQPPFQNRIHKMSTPPRVLLLAGDFVEDYEIMVPFQTLLT